MAKRKEKGGLSKEGKMGEGKINQGRSPVNRCRLSNGGWGIQNGGNKLLSRELKRGGGEGGMGTIKDRRRDGEPRFSNQRLPHIYTEKYSFRKEETGSALGVYRGIRMEEGGKARRGGWDY